MKKLSYILIIFVFILSFIFSEFVIAKEQRIMACPGQNSKYSGIVIAAPHEGYDINTEPIAHKIASNIGLAFVTAAFFRDIGAKRYINVNRPTGMFPENFNRDNRDKESPFPRAQEVYDTYHHLLKFAAHSLPAKFLIEIHGHSRRDFENQRMQVIEVAHRGVSEFRLRLLRDRYLMLCSTYHISDPVPMYFEGLNEKYSYKGREYNFRYKADNTKRIGSFSPGVCKGGIHVELPSSIRFNRDNIKLYTELFSDLIKWYLKIFYCD